MTAVDAVLDAAGPWAGTLRAALASLPRSFSVVRAPPGGRTWVAALDGAPGWAARAHELSRLGAACVVLLIPAPEHPATLAGLGGGLAPVVVQTPWSGNPGLAAARAAAASRGLPVVPEGPGLRCCRLVLPQGSDLRAALAHQLALLRTTFGAVAEIRAVSFDPCGYCAQLILADGAPVTASAVVSDATPPSAELLAVGSTGMAETVLPWWTSATPAVVRWVDALGERTAACVYESALRSTWRRAHDVAVGARAEDDLAGWTEDLATTAAVSTAGVGDPG